MGLLTTSLVLLHAVVVILCGLNDWLLFSSQWIISPAAPESQARPYSSFSSTTTSIIYAIVEPLYYHIFLRSPLPPWFFAYQLTPLHLLFSWVSAETLKNATRDQAVTISDAASNEKDVEQSRCTAATPTQAPALTSSAVSSRLGKVAILVSIQTAAFSNAAILLYARDFAPPFPGTGQAADLALTLLAVTFHLGSRCADVHISRTSQRASYLGQHGISYAKAQLKSLVVLLLTRAAVRILLGQPPIVSFRGLSSLLAS